MTDEATPRTRGKKTEKGGPTFRFAPPFVERDSFGRKAPKLPFAGANEWQNSVYYFWWAYLRFHEGYCRTCAQDGRGAFRKLYADFGNVHKGTFRQWWKTHGVELFAEPRTERARIMTADEASRIATDHLLIVVPVDRKYRTLMRHIGLELRPALKLAKEGRPLSRAKYKISGKPVLHALHTHLRVWRIRQKNPNLKLHEIAVKAGLGVGGANNPNDPKRALATLARRHITIAEEYIESAASTEFPRRKGRAITKGP